MLGARFWPKDFFAAGRPFEVDLDLDLDILLGRLWGRGDERDLALANTS